MYLTAKAIQANGLKGSGRWYIASEYVDDAGRPSFTMSMDVNRALFFTPDEADRFNEKFKKLGIISKPFDTL